MTPAQIHNRNAAAIVQQIIKPTLDAGGEMTDVLVLLESVILGVMFVSVKLGGDEIVLDQVVAGVKMRLAQQRLGNLETAGRARPIVEHSAPSVVDVVIIRCCLLHSVKNNLLPARNTPPHHRPEFFCIVRPNRSR